VSVEQIKAWNELGQTIGVPAFIIVVFVVATGSVFIKVVWPWIVKRLERQDAEYSKRHEGYIEEQKANVEENKATTQVLMLMRESLDKHENQATRRNEDLRELMNRRFDELLREIKEMGRR
jgi:hypothetical protein